MRLVFVGPPGAGKGTQAVIVATRLGIPHISTGDLFRAHVAAQDELGVRVKQYLDAGQLVPDLVTNDMVSVRLAKPDAMVGFLLDGYPRNSAQVDVLTNLLDASGEQLDAVVEFVVDRRAVTQRLLDRATQLGRTDDTAEVIADRFAVYDNETSPVANLYRAAGLLRVVDAMGSVDDVTSRVLDALPLES